MTEVMIVNAFAGFIIAVIIIGIMFAIVFGIMLMMRDTSNDYEVELALINIQLELASLEKKCKKNIDIKNKL